MTMMRKREKRILGTRREKNTEKENRNEEDREVIDERRNRTRITWEGEGRREGRRKRYRQSIERN